jgi:hypothetical protein
MSPHKRAIILRYAASELLEAGRLIATHKSPTPHPRLLWTRAEQAGRHELGGDQSEDAQRHGVDRSQAKGLLVYGSRVSVVIHWFSFPACSWSLRPETEEHHCRPVTRARAAIGQRAHRDSRQTVDG